MKLALLSAMVFVGLWVGVSGFSHHAEPVLSRYFIEPDDALSMREVAQRFEVVAKTKRGYEIIAPASESDFLKARSLRLRVLEPDISKIFQRLSQRSPGWFRDYHNYESALMHTKRLAFRYPRIAKMIPYGKSQQGRELLALKLSDNVWEDEDEPELLITSATHGDELITVEVILGLLDQLTQGYDQNDRFTKMINEHELYFVPVVNPDGYSQRLRYANGKDPNREYPWPGNPHRVPVTCIQKIIEFFGERDIVGSLDFHAHGRLIMYPWAYSYSSVQGDLLARYREVGRQMAAQNNYRVGQIANIMYIAQGSSADYYHWKKNSLSYGIEISYSMAPPSSQIPNEIRDSAEMTWKFIESF